jgi:hypothetical protein
VTCFATILRSLRPRAPVDGGASLRLRRRGWACGDAVLTTERADRDPDRASREDGADAGAVRRASKAKSALCEPDRVGRPKSPTRWSAAWAEACGVTGWAFWRRLENQLKRHPLGGAPGVVPKNAAHCDRRVAACTIYSSGRRIRSDQQSVSLPHAKFLRSKSSAW